MIIEGRDITRFSGDTYPENFKIQIDKKLVNLDGWDVYFIYDEIQIGLPEETKTIRITGVTNQFRKGEVKFFPRDEYSFDITSGSPGTAYQAFEIAGTHEYKITREKDFYYANASGTLVTLDDGDTYVAYDSGNPAHDGLTRYNLEREIMTHDTGSLEIQVLS